MEDATTRSAPGTAAAGRPTGSRPLVIAHRGASGHRPEHTLEAYALGARLGADFLECDLVPTADGVLVARHESELSGTTDVGDHPELAGRRTTKEVDGQLQSGWFTEDLTLAELRTLCARERLGALRPGNTAWDGRWAIPTLQEIVALARALGRELGRPIGVYPETKHPAHFRRLGLPLEEPLAAALDGAADGVPSVPAMVQSFEPDSLRRVRALLDVPLVQLLGPDDPPDLEAMASWVSAVGAAKELLVPRTASGASGAPTSLVADAHRAGLAVHAWTYRAENAFLPLERRSSADPAAHGDLRGELEQALGLGLDGVFCDHPDVAAALIGPR